MFMKQLWQRLYNLVKHPVARGSIIVFLGSIFGNFAAYIYHLIVGRMLGPSGYGELAALFSLFYLLNVPSGVLQTVLTKYLSGFRAKGEYGRAKSVSIGAIKRLALLGLVGAILLGPFIGNVSEFLHIEKPASLFFIYLTSVVGLLTIVQVSLLQAFQKFSQSVMVANIGATLRVCGGIIGALFGVVETVIAGVITSMVGFIAYIVPLRFIYSSSPKPVNISKKEVTSYAMPSLVTILGMTSLYSTDILLAKHFLSPTEAGFYAALSVMGKIIFFASSNISYVLFPVIAERTSQKTHSHKLVYGALFGVFVLSVCVTLGYFLFPRFVLLLLFGVSYYPAAPYLGWFGVFLTLYSLCHLLVTTFLGRGDVKVWLFVGFAAILQIVTITLMHSGITAFILVNISIMLSLFLSLLLYYRYAIKAH